MKKERIIPDEYQMEEILNRSFKNIPNKAFKPTLPEEKKINIDFLSSSENFWLSHSGGKYFQKYSEGLLNGTYNTRAANFKSISETLVESIKSIIRSQCEEEDKTLEEFNIYLEVLEKSFELLSNKLNSSLKNSVNGEMMMAYLHAVLNSFITTNIKR